MAGVRPQSGTAQTFLCRPQRRRVLPAFEKFTKTLSTTAAERSANVHKSKGSVNSHRAPMSRRRSDPPATTGRPRLCPPAKHNAGVFSHLRSASHQEPRPPAPAPHTTRTSSVGSACTRLFQAVLEQSAFAGRTVCTCCFLPFSESLKFRTGLSSSRRQI
jgi:hypothetical protein